MRGKGLLKRLGIPDLRLPEQKSEVSGIGEAFRQIGLSASHVTAMEITRKLREAGVISDRTKADEVLLRYLKDLEKPQPYNPEGKPSQIER